MSGSEITNTEFRIMNAEILNKKIIMKSYFLSICFFVLLSLLVSISIPAQDSLVIKSGPYLSCATQTSIIIAWQTDSPCASIVEYGLTEDLGFEVIDTNPDTIHAIKLTALTPSTTYYYRVKSDSAVSGKNTFQTAVTQDEDFAFVIYGDNRTNQADHLNVVNRIITLEPGIVLNTGDLVEFGRLQSLWDIYFDTIKELAKNTPIYVSIGNHEEEHPLYYDQHFLPHNNPDSTEEYYSFDYGRCHFIALNTNLSVPYEPGSAQYRWLENDLRAANSADYIIVFFHHPPYSSSSTTGGSLKVRENLCPLFERYGVDLVFNGHYHNYERFYPINGVTYIVTGGGGAPLADVGARQSWSAYAEKTLHCIKAKVTADSINLRMIRPDSSIGDRVTILGPNAMLVQHIAEQHNFDSIIVTVHYSDDRNSNGSAVLEHKLAADAVWISDGNMTRTDSSYLFTIPDLTPDSTYDLKISCHDPDGVRGDSVTILADIRMLPVKTTINTLWATTTDDAIQVKAFYAGDANQNNAANIKYKLSAETDWLDSGLMLKETALGCYSQIISNIITGQNYDVEVAFSDPDGIVGNRLQAITNLPTAKPTLPPHSTAITIDGDLTDWLTIAPEAADTLILDQANGELLWQDARDDDQGDGGDAPLVADNPAAYAYPTLTAIHGTEADIEQFRMAYDLNYVYFLVDLADSISHPQLPLSIILIDTDGAAHGNKTVDYNTEISLGEYRAWDFELALTENCIRITDAAGNDVSEGALVFQNLGDNLFEVAVPASTFGNLAGIRNVALLQTLNLGTGGSYSALEVKYSAETLQGGGGIDGETDPDIYDLIGAKYPQQCADLNNYTDSTFTIIRHSWLEFVFSYSTLDVCEIGSQFPLKFRLEQNYPNPFNATTTIIYELSENTHLTLKIFNLIGQQVRTLVDNQMSGGQHKAIWDGFDNRGQPVTSGIYFCQIKAGEMVITRKLILLR